MKDLSTRVSRKTGLSKQECDGIIKVITYEIVMGLKDSGFVNIEGLGTLFRSHLDSNGIIILNPIKEVVNKLNEPYTGERVDEIIFK